MSDRNDPSQYPNQADGGGYAWEGDTTIDNDLIQENAEGTYAEPEELVGYHNVGNQQDYMADNPGNYRNNPTDKRFVAVSRLLPGTTGPVVTSPARISGWSVRETTGTTSAVLRFRDGLDIGNQTLITISLAPGESARDFLTLPIDATRAVFLEVVSGTVDGNLFTVEERNV